MANPWITMPEVVVIPRGVSMQQVQDALSLLQMIKFPGVPMPPTPQGWLFVPEEAGTWVLGEKAK